MCIRTHMRVHTHRGFNNQKEHLNVLHEFMINLKMYNLFQYLLFYSCVCVENSKNTPSIYTPQHKHEHQNRKFCVKILQEVFMKNS
jgi:hypothetical protein